MALSRAVLDLNKKAFDPRGLVSHAAQAIYLHYDLSQVTLYTLKEAHKLNKCIKKER